MITILETTCSRNTDALKALALRVQEALDRGGVTLRCAYKIQLAIEESIRNLIEHAQGVTSDLIVVRIIHVTDHFEVVIEDDSAPFDPHQAPLLNVDAPLAERRSGGMGIHLLLHFLDGLDYGHVDGRNQLRMRIKAR